MSNFDYAYYAYNRYVNLEGKPISKTPETNPYNYDEFVLYKSDLYRKGQHADYSDRLWEYDHKHFESCTEKVWGNHGQYFGERASNPEKIEEFLTLYNRKPTILTAIVQGCNVSNGYPYWVFFYVYSDEAAKTRSEETKTIIEY